MLRTRPWLTPLILYTVSNFGPPSLRHHASELLQLIFLCSTLTSLGQMCFKPSFVGFHLCCMALTMVHHHRKREFVLWFLSPMNVEVFTVLRFELPFLSIPHLNDLSVGVPVFNLVWNHNLLHALSEGFDVFLGSPWGPAVLRHGLI